MKWHAVHFLISQVNSGYLFLMQKEAMNEQVLSLIKYTCLNQSSCLYTCLTLPFEAIDLNLYSISNVCLKF